MADNGDSPAADQAAGPLAGIRVLDLADEKGLACTKFLADLGADVIKIEHPHGDPTRRRPPFAKDKPDLERSLYYLHYNANKRGITLDLSRPDGQEILRRLVASTDVVVETFRPGTLSGWGLGYESLSELNAGLILASITWFGQTGPYRDFQGDELIAFALGGLMAITGEPGQPPTVAPGEVSCGMASVYAVLALEVAVFHRLRTGRGQYIDVSVAEAAAHIGSYILPVYSHTRAKPARTSRAKNTLELNDLSPCKDGWVRLVMLPKEHWLAFLDWIGRPEELLDPRFEQLNVRSEHSELISGYMDRFFSGYSKKDLYAEAQKRHLALSPMNTPGAFVENEQTRARNFFQETSHPAVGDYLQIGAMHRYSESPTRVSRPAPLLGQHNDEVLGHELGLSSNELARLRRASVI